MTQQPADAMPEPFPSAVAALDAIPELPLLFNTKEERAAWNKWKARTFDNEGKVLSVSSRPSLLSAETAEKIREAKRLLEPFKSYGDGVAQAVAYRMLEAALLSPKPTDDGGK